MSTGEALNQAAANLSQQFIQMMLANRQYSVQQAQLGQEQQRIGLQEQAQQAQAQSGALERLIAMAPFLPEGKTIAEMPELHSTMQTAFPEFDPTHPADLGGVVFNQQTVDDLLRPMLIDRIQRLPEENRNQLLERGANRAILGIPASGTELQAQNTRAGLFLQAWNTMKGDPHALEGILRSQVGLEVPTRVQYQGREITFDTSSAASITAQLMMHRDQMAATYAGMNRGTQMDIAGELMGQMQKNGINLGRAAAARIVGAYDQMSRLAADGKLTEQNNPLMTLYGSATPEEKTAIQAFTGAVSFGENGYQQYLNQTPNGRQLMNFIQVGTALHGAGVPQDQIPGLMEQISSAQGGFSPPGGQGSQQFQLPSYQAPGFFGNMFGGNTLHFQQAPQPTTGPSAENLRSQMTKDATDLAHGRISAADIARKYRDPDQRAAIIRASRSMRH